MAYVALTVRKIKDGKVDEFLEKFGPPDERPKNLKAFYAIRNVENPDELITFGFFEGTLEELNETQGEGYQEIRNATDGLVESFGASGIYEVVVQDEG